MFQCMLGYFDDSIIHQTLTWTTASLTCLCNLFALYIYIHTHGGTLVYNVIRRIFVEAAQNLMLEKSQGE